MSLILWWFCVITIIGILVKIVNKIRTPWCQSYTCLVGKTAIVTGSNTGIGFVTALDFAKRGARVILACRNKEKAEEARTKIITQTGNENVIVKLIDLTSFKSVREFAKNINTTEKRLDILVNNAGAADGREEKTIDGNVFLMQVNYFSPFLLTILLIGLLKKTGSSRIVNVASIGASYALNFNVDNLNNHPGIVQLLYFHTKLCNILFTIELAKKLEGTKVTAYSLHPGCIKTDMMRYVTGFFSRPLMIVIANTFFKSCEEGSQTIIYTAVEKGIEKYTGCLFDRCQKADLYRTASDPKLPKKLWENTEKLLQLTPEEQFY